MNEYNNDLIQVAARVMWFEPTEKVISNTFLFLSYLMTYGTISDILIAKKYYTDDDFKSALQKAPIGIFDKKSWAYWNTVYNILPIPELPQRKL